MDTDYRFVLDTIDSAIANAEQEKKESLHITGMVFARTVVLCFFENRSYENAVLEILEAHRKVKSDILYFTARDYKKDLVVAKGCKSVYNLSLNLLQPGLI